MAPLTLAALLACMTVAASIAITVPGAGQYDWLGSLSADPAFSLDDAGAWPAPHTAPFPLMPGHALAQTALTITAADSLADDDTLVLGNVQNVEAFTIGENTYVISTSRLDNGVQIIDVTDPADIEAAGSLASRIGLERSRGVSTFTITSGGTTGTYAAVASVRDHTFNIINITNPDSPAVTDSLSNNATLELTGVYDVNTFQIGASTYAAATAFADDGVQIIDVTDPADISAVSRLQDHDTDLDLDGPRDITAFTIDTGTYVAVAVDNDDTVHIVDVSTPASPSVVGSLADGGALLLDRPNGVDTFQITASGTTKTYVAVTSQGDAGVQIIDVSTPASPAAVGSLADTDSLLRDGAQYIRTVYGEGYRFDDA